MICKLLVKSCMSIGVACLALVGSTAFAQLDTGTIQGTVRDSTGALIANANVVCIDTGTERTYTSKTSEQGEYACPGLEVGTYNVQASEPGFSPANVTGIKLHASELHRADLTLKAGGADTQVTVTADQLAVNTLSADLGTTIEANRVANLPLNGRDFTDLLALVPGSVTTAGFGQTSLGGVETSFAGVNILLDGTDASRIDTNATSMQLGREQARITRASVDSVAEFHVLQGNFSAEYGRSLGDVVNVITKSGTNKYHGELFEFIRNNALDAKNYFALPGQSTPLRLNQFGGNFGGPIVHDKLFFFVNYEGVRQTITNITQFHVLNAAQRAKFVPAMAPVLAAIPTGNAGPDPANPALFDLYNASLPDKLQENTGSAKLDWTPSAKDHYSIRYNINDSNTTTTFGPAVGQTAPTPARSQFLKLSYTRTFSPTLINEAGFAINSNDIESFGGGGNFSTLAISCFFCDFGVAPGPATFEVISPQTSYEYVDTATKVLNRQTIKFGADIRHNLSDRALGNQQFLSYGSVSDFQNNAGFALSTLGFPLVRFRTTNYGFFVQDDIRLTPNFTLNAGLRYEYNTVIHEQDNRVVNFDIANQKPFAPGQAFYNPDRNNFAPRIGFSWDPYGHGRTAVRGGFGIFYNPQLTGAVTALTDNTFHNFSVNIFQLLFGTVNCTPALSLSYPLPPQLPSCVPSPSNADSIQTNLRDSYSLHYTFGVQQELATNVVLDVSYAANRGLKLPAGAAFAGLQLNTANPFTGVRALNQNFADERVLGDYLSSSYNSMQVALRGHTSRLTYDVNYTWSHEFDDGVSVFSAFVDPTNPKRDYSEGDIDVRNNFTADALYTAPAIPRLPKLIGGGWQLSTIVQARSGLPVNITTGVPNNYSTPQRPDPTGVSPYPTSRMNPGNQLNRAAYLTPAVAPGVVGTPDVEFGTLRRNSARGPHYAQADVSFFKNTPIKEGISTQLRADIFNIVNHPNFANPDGNLTDASFGQSTSTIGNLVGNGTSRQIQFAFKLTF